MNDELLEQLKTLEVDTFEVEDFVELGLYAADMPMGGMGLSCCSSSCSCSSTVTCSDSCSVP